MLLEVETKLRLNVADARELDKQSIFVFGLYRSGSSVIGVAAKEFAKSNNLVPVDVFQNLYESGVSPVDPTAEPRAPIHLADQGRGLAQLCDLPGYVFHGFREVPIGFAEAFSDPGRAIIFVRDPRDIGISHYFYSSKHTTRNRIIGKSILNLRNITSNRNLEEFLIEDYNIEFLNRICLSYKNLINLGVKVVKYEDLFVDDKFNNSKLLKILCRHFSDKCNSNFSIEQLEKNLESSIKRSVRLKSHKTSGSIELFKSLSSEKMSLYTKKLSDCLYLLGYK